MSSKPSARRPWHHPLALAQRLVVYALIAYVVVCVFMFSLQTYLIYPTINPDFPVQAAQSVGLVPWEHTTPGASAPQGYVRPDFAKPAPRGTIVVFHGNGTWCGARTDYANAFTRRGFRVFLYEYPGYGGRPGVPSERSIVPDAQALVRSLDQTGFGPIYVWGESLGSGVAAAVCADKTLPVHGLALLTPWDNLANVGRSFYPLIPVRLLLKDKYDSIANLEHFAHPICVIRSEHDEIILPPLSLNLFAHLPDPKKIILQSGYGHNDWPSGPDETWWDEALNFITK